jgi:hypothetical protein
MRRLAVAVLVGALVGGCRGGDGGGADDKAACQTLKDAEGENPDIYRDLLRMDLSADMRTALTELRDSTAGDEVREDTFEKARRVDALCTQKGVILSG